MSKTVSDFGGISSISQKSSLNLWRVLDRRRFSGCCVMSSSLSRRYRSRHSIRCFMIFMALIHFGSSVATHRPSLTTPPARGRPCGRSLGRRCAPVHGFAEFRAAPRNSRKIGAIRKNRGNSQISHRFQNPRCGKAWQGIVRW